MSPSFLLLMGSDQQTHRVSAPAVPVGHALTKGATTMFCAVRPCQEYFELPPLSAQEQDTRSVPWDMRPQLSRRQSPDKTLLPRRQTFRHTQNQTGHENFPSRNSTLGVTRVFREFSGVFWIAPSDLAVYGICCSFTRRYSSSSTTVPQLSSAPSAQHSQNIRLA